MTRRHLVAILALCAASLLGLAQAAPLTAFTGDKSEWHGFDRYDFLMDEQTLAISPFRAPASEGAGVKDPEKGQRRCIVVVPKEAAPGNPWSWRGCYWDHQPQTEIELLKRGFHVAYISANATLKPGKEWDAWHAFLTDEHGLSKKPAFVGMSRGGEYAYTWATGHPDKVSCIYADNPGMNREALAKLGELARNDVPLLHVCGSIDPILGKNSTVIENIYQQLGGRISVMIKEGYGHHPHSLRDPAPIVDFIMQSVQAVPATPPAFAGAKFAKTAFYGTTEVYRDDPAEGAYLTCRGPIFFGSYDRYEFNLPNIEGAVTVIAPATNSPGMPWVFRADFVDRHDAVALALLSRGFHVVTGPVPFNADGPRREDWGGVYKYLTAHGFSPKPVMGGAGGAAGEAYAWAIANPDKVSCVYAENPLLRSRMMKGNLVDLLAPLAKAGVPLLNVCGSVDPLYNDNARALEQRYKELGGEAAAIVKEGQGHYPLGPTDLKPVVDFITAHSQHSTR
ncbi:MAG: alpha/beta fold hydrolase [Limisphaerales bacterium]